MKYTLELCKFYFFILIYYGFKIFKNTSFFTTIKIKINYDRESLKVTTAAGSERVANYAFEFCYLSGRKKVTAVHKANIMFKIIIYLLSYIYHFLLNLCFI